MLGASSGHWRRKHNYGLVTLALVKGVTAAGGHGSPPEGGRNSQRDREHEDAGTNEMDTDEAGAGPGRETARQQERSDMVRISMALGFTFQDGNAAATTLNQATYRDEQEGTWRPEDGPPQCALDMQINPPSTSQSQRSELASQTRTALLSQCPTNCITEEGMEALLVSASYHQTVDTLWVDGARLTQLPICPLDTTGMERLHYPNTITIDITGIALETTPTEITQMLQDLMILEPVAGTMHIRAGTRRFAGAESRGHGVGTALVTVTVQNTMRVWGAFLGRDPIRITTNEHNPLNNPRGGERSQSPSQILKDTTGSKAHSGGTSPNGCESV